MIKLFSLWLICWSAISLAQENPYEKWGNHFANDIGKVLNPPTGRISSDIKSTEAYLLEMLNNLAGEELSAKKIPWVLTIYPNKTPNAFAAQVIYPEGLPKYPYMTAELGPQRIVHEIGVTTGLLKLAKTEAELAFVISHELGHLLEGHTLEPQKERSYGGDYSSHDDFNERIKNWWHSQRHETIADYVGVQRMIGKYNLDGATEMLTKLAAQKPEHRNKVSGAEAALGTHHHEGVRISMVQSHIEYLRRQNKKAQLFETTTLPQYTQFLLDDRFVLPDVPSKDFEVIRRQELARLIEFVHTEKYRQVKLEEVRYRSKLGDADPSREQRKQMIVDAARLIELQDWSGAKKVNTFLEVLFYMNRFMLSLREQERLMYWKNMSEQDLREITSFLAKNSNGPHAWTAESFFANAFKAVKDEYRFFWLYNQRLAVFAQNPEVQQKIIDRLIRSGHEEWREFIRLQPELILYGRTGVLNVEYFVNYLWALTQKESMLVLGPKYRGQLYETLKADALHIIETADAEKWVRDWIAKGGDRGKFSFHQFKKQLKEKSSGDSKGNYDKEFLKQILSALEPLDTMFTDFRDKTAIEFMNKTRHNDVKFGVNFLESFFATLNHYPVDPRNKESLQRAFLNFARYSRDVNLMISGNNTSMSKGGVTFITEILSSSQFTASEKALAFETLITATEYNIWRIGFDLDKTVLKNLNRYMNTIEAKTLLSTLKTNRAGNDAYFIEYLKHRYNVTANGENLTQTIRHMIDNDLLKHFKDAEDRNDFWEIYRHAGADANRRMAWINFISLDMDFAYEYAKRISWAELNEILDLFSKYDLELRIKQNLSSPGRDYFRTDIFGEAQKTLTVQAAEFLTQVMRTSLSEIPSLKEWAKTYKKIYNLNSVGVEQNPKLKKALREDLTQRLLELPIENRYQWLREKRLFKLLDSQSISDWIIEYGKKRGKLANPETLGRFIAAADKQFNLQKKYPDTYIILRNQLSEVANLQPKNFEQVFPPSENESGDLTKKSSEFGNQIRGMSYIVAEVRQENWQRQISFIEYIMGRTDKMPDFVLEKSRQRDAFENKVPLDTLVLTARQRLDRESWPLRVMVANSFLAGPTSFIATPEGEKNLVDHLLQDIRGDKKELGNLLARAILHSQGNNRSLAFAYIMSQAESGESNQRTKEAKILHQLFNAFGVPGIKLGQYLGFTAALKEYQSAFESLQDAAMPINYFGILELLKERFGESWPEKYRIVKMLGSGSVNIAIEYEDLKTGERNVAQIARSQIEIAVHEDFRRFRAALEYVLSDPEYSQKFDFIRGLINIIEKSVALEFNKEHVFKMQKFAEGLYNQRINGWKVQTVAAFETRNMTVFMEKAPGKTARKVYKNNPEAYKSAMAAINQVEWNVLMGVQNGQRTQPLPLFANPDFHDGQVLIDEKKRTVTILDFGQAVRISNADREIGIRILQVISQSVGEKKSLEIINELIAKEPKAEPMTRAEIRNLRASKDRMDFFIHLIAKVSQKGYEIPLSSIHWVLGINRLLALSDKIGGANMVRLKLLLILEKFGVDLKTYNDIRRTGEKFTDFISQPMKGVAPARSCQTAISLVL